MAFTFGGATSHYVGFDSDVTVSGNGRTSLVCGWYFPTTLTAGRKLFGAGAVWGAEIDTTTDELRLRTANVTTDGQWTTTDVDLAVDEWKFVAVMNTTLNTGSADAWRVWVGTANTAPVAVTVTEATASAGNFSGTQAFYIANNSGTASSFQGDIENVVGIFTSATIGVTTHPFSQATYGTITAAEEQIALERYVLPIWSGEPPPLSGSWPATAIFWAPLFIPGTASSVGVRARIHGTATSVAIGITSGGGSNSNNAGPRQTTLTTQQFGSPQLVRR